MTAVGGTTLAGWAAVGSVVVSLTLGIWSVIRAGRSARAEQMADEAKTKVDDASAAFEIWKGTVDELRTEVGRLKEEVVACHEGRDADRATIEDLRTQVSHLRARLEEAGR